MKQLAPVTLLAFALTVAGCREGGSKAPPTRGSTLAAASVTSETRGAGIAPAASQTTAAPASATPAVAAAPLPDTQSPEIEVLEPARGVATPNGTVRLVARVRDASGIDTVLLNGTPVPVRNDQIEANVPLDAGLNLLEVVAIDGAGNQEQAVVPVLGGDFLPADQRVPQALAVRLNKDVFAEVSRAVSQKLGGRDLERDLLRRNPLFKDSEGLTKLEVNATGFENGRASVSLTPQNGGLAVSARVPNVRLQSKVKGKAGFIPFGATVTISASQVRLSARAVASVDRAGKVQTSLQNVDVSFEGFDFDVKWVPSFLERLARNKVRNTLEQRLAAQLGAELTPKLQEAIAGAIKPIRRSILGHTIRFDVRPGELSFDPQGLGMTLDMNLGVEVPAGTRIPQSPGSLYVPVTRAPQAQTGPSFELSAHTNLLNRIAHTVWQGGLVNLALDEAAVDKLKLPPALKLDAFMLTVIFPELTGKLGDTTTPVRLEVDLGLPPVFSTTGRQGLELSAGDVTLNLILTPPGAPEQLVARLGIQVEATLEAEIREQRFRAQVVGMPTAKIDAFEHPIVPLSSIGMQNLLDVVLPEVLKHQTRLMTGFPLPTVPLVTPKQVELKNDPRSPGYLDLSGNL